MERSRDVIVPCIQQWEDRRTVRFPIMQMPRYSIQLDSVVIDTNPGRAAQSGSLDTVRLLDLLVYGTGNSHRRYSNRTHVRIWRQTCGGNCITIEQHVLEFRAANTAASYSGCCFGAALMLKVVNKGQSNWHPPENAKVSRLRKTSCPSTYCTYIKR